jgi:hypothetical protein
MQQIHGLRPLFQYDSRGAFRASAAKIGVHRKPPSASRNNRRLRSHCYKENRASAQFAAERIGAVPTLRFGGFCSIQWNTYGEVGDYRASKSLWIPGSRLLLRTAIPFGI